MFQIFKRLTGDTALYGLSSILGRVINFALVPLHTRVLTQAGYGVSADIYAWLAFLMVVLTYGFESAYFRFAEKYADKRALVFATATRSILITTVVFFAFVFFFQTPVLEAIRYEEHPEYLWLALGIIFCDVISAVPLAQLRSERRVIRFVRNRLIVICSNVLLNAFFYLGLPLMAEADGWVGELGKSLWDPNFGVGYLLVANVIASAWMVLDLLPEFLRVRAGFDWDIWKKMLRFGYPLMLAGLAGISNEMIDRQFIKYLLPEDISLQQLGIYSAVYKFSIALILFNQAFRYAAEPLFFAEGEHGTDRRVFAYILRAFTIVMCFGMVLILALADPLKQLILGEEFWGGIHILPWLLIANVFLGIHTNVSIWYKLADKTQYGVYITGIGLIFTLALNFWLIPIMGIEGAAIATLASYSSMALASWIFGRIHYPIPYATGALLFYLFISSLLGYLAFRFAQPDYTVQVACVLAFLVAVYLLEKSHIHLIVARLKRRK